MLTVRKVASDNWYLEYNGRFVESFNRKKDATEQVKLLKRKGLLPC